MHALVDIAALPGVASKEFYSHLRDHYMGLIEVSAREVHSEKPKVVDNTMSWSDASKQMWAIMKLKKRVECGG